MSKEIAGRTFSTPEEAGVEPPTAQELEEYGKTFREARQKLRAASPDPEVLASSKFHDEISGTELDPRRGVWAGISGHRSVISVGESGRQRMFHERNVCHFCGRFALEAEGWAESIPPYHPILATWDDDANFFNGSFHVGCVRAFERRGEFRQAMVDWLTATNRLITVHGEDGQPHEISSTGLGYTEKIAELSDGEIYEDPRFNRWVFIEEAGPYHFLELDAAEALSAGDRIRGDGGGTSVVLPTEPDAGIESWNLPGLLNFLAVRDLYQGLLDDLEPKYEFWEGGVGRAGYILTYSLSAIRPLPSSIGDFFARYLPNYTSKRLEDA